MTANVFTKFSIATTGAAFLILQTISMAPAKATSLTKLDYTGTFNASIVSPIQGNIGPVAVNESITVDNLSDLIGDSESTLDNFSSYLKDFTDLFAPSNITLSSFNGSGSVSQNGNFLSNFNFLYDQPSEILTVNGYNVANIQPCLSGTCQLSGNGNFSVGVDGVPISGNVNFDLTQTATPLPEEGTQPTTFLALSKTLSAAAQPVSNSKSVPEPSAVLGFLGLGGLFAAKRKLQKYA